MNAEQKAERALAEMREALEACGDYAFGVWDDDSKRLEAGRKAEALARAALCPEEALERAEPVIE